MTICYASREFFPFYYGGIGSHFYFQMRMLRDRGHSIVFVTVDYDNVNDEMLNKYWEGIEIIKLANTEGILSGHENLNNSFRLWKGLEKLVYEKKYSFDYLVVADCGAEGFFTIANKILYGKLPDTRILMEIEGPMKDVAVRNRDYMDVHYEITSKMEEFCFANTEFYTTPTTLMWDELSSFIPADRAKYEVIPNLVNKEFSEIERNSESVNKDLFFMGRLEYRKGPDILLQAFLNLIEDAPEICGTLKIAGRDQYWSDYKKTFQEHWSEILNAKQLSKIDYLQFLGHDELFNELHKIRAAVFPSRWEPFGNVALESILAGIPVILPANTGLAKITGPEYPFLFETGNSLDLEEKLKSILELEKEEYERLSDSLKERGRFLLQESETRFLSFLNEGMKKDPGVQSAANNASLFYEIMLMTLELGGGSDSRQEELFSDYLKVNQLYLEKSKFYDELETEYKKAVNENNLMKEYLRKIQNSKG